VLSILEGTIAGQYFFDDFNDFPLIGTQTTEIAHGRYKVFNTGSGTVSQVSTINSTEYGGGYLQISLDTNNDSGSIAQSYPSFLLKSTSKKLWFEARVAYSPIVTNGIGWILGLGEVEQWTLATAVPLNASDAPTNSGSFIGFQKPEDDLVTMDTVYVDRSTSFTKVLDSAATITAAFEFVKLGFVFDPDAEAAHRITFYVNNIPSGTYVSATTLSALTYLDANALGLMFTCIADSAGTSGLAYLDWWRCAQLG
jgi:hypothetical protein